MLRMVPAPGAGCASCHDIRFKLVCNWGRAAAALVRFANNCTTESGRLQLLGIPGGISVWGGFWLALKGQDSQQLSGLQFMQLMQFG